MHVCIHSSYYSAPMSFIFRNCPGNSGGLRSSVVGESDYQLCRYRRTLKFITFFTARAQVEIRVILSTGLARAFIREPAGMIKLILLIRII